MLVEPWLGNGAPYIGITCTAHTGKATLRYLGGQKCCFENPVANNVAKRSAL